MLKKTKFYFDKKVQRKYYIKRKDKAIPNIYTQEGFLYVF